MEGQIYLGAAYKGWGKEMKGHIVPVARLEDFRALKSSKLEYFRALKPYGQIGGF